MSQEKIIELQERVFLLERKIKPLEWDAGRNQINEFKLKELGRLKEENTSLHKELAELRQKC
ncbi:hypothetical protein COV17_04365 [Candidatus Woesearchaeota archaeon CG10_big_fil_rev_8_21_14_0_10_36_11]|nr:MAG: hypothetical protein COV17_04365 [Candidatus Woesearchaeota archaeon CG10_big_fil_rev_8_21_14_0_10_36_11]